MDAELRDAVLKVAKGLEREEGECLSRLMDKWQRADEDYWAANQLGRHWPARFYRAQRDRIENRMGRVIRLLVQQARKEVRNA